jgi:hypothetical protein
MRCFQVDLKRPGDFGGYRLVALVSAETPVRAIMKAEEKYPGLVGFSAQYLEVEKK